jgi:hypothetical protein
MSDGMRLAPIALFVYNRPWHTRQTIEALRGNDLAAESNLFIFSDGAKNSQESIAAVKEVREYLQTVGGFKSIKIAERSENIGLAESVITGVTQLCRQFGRVIVLEDDLLTGPDFLRYMNDALEFYQDAHKVMQVSAHMFPVVVEAVQDAFFLPFVTSWGWATWDRAWSSFDRLGHGYALLEKDKALRNSFDLDGAYPYFNMLQSQLRGRIDSWAIRWNLSVFLSKGLVLCPKQSLVTNIGFDGSGTHCGILLVEQMNQGDFRPRIFPTELEIRAEHVDVLRRHFINGKKSKLLKLLMRFRTRCTNYIHKLTPPKA